MNFNNLKNQWMWEGGPLRGLLALAFICLALALGLFPWLGGRSCFFLIGAGMALSFYATYRVIGRKVGRLQQQAGADGQAVIQSLIARDFLQSPGVIVIADNAILFKPLVGGDFTLPYSEIVGFGQSRWFNGSLQIGKTGFVFKTRKGGRLGVAVPNAFVPQLKDALEPCCHKAPGQN